MDDKTAKFFHDHLLLTLTELVGGQAGVGVSHQTVYLPVAIRAGFSSLDQYGNDASSGQPKVIKWIQWAYKDLRRKGLAVLLRRGNWALTSKGLKRAQDLLLLQPSAQENSPVAVPPAPSVEDEGSLTDPYLLALRQARTPCFGYYSSKSTICGSCPIQVSCQAALPSVYLQRAKVLVRNESSPEDGLDDGGILHPSSIATSHIIAAGTLKFLRVAGVQQPCVGCQQVIPGHPQTYWVCEGVFSDPVDKKVVYHQECLPKDWKTVLLETFQGGLV